MSLNRSFERAVFEGQINGPLGSVFDDTPVIDIVTLEFPLENGSSIIAKFPKERTFSVMSVSGTKVGEVVDFQHQQ